MPCKTYLRHDQTSSQRTISASKNVAVYAPTWVRECLKILGGKLKGIEFEVHEKPSLKRGRNVNSSTPKILERFKITEDFNNQNLVILQKIARNEARNTNGLVNTSYYSPDIKDVNIIYSIKDLARQCIIVGRDTTTFYGGYKNPRVKQSEPVYICDLPALQFQKPYNSGRLVLLQEKDPHLGILDNLIFENVVQEKRKTFQDVAASYSQNQQVKTRYLKHTGYGKQSKGTCFFDTFAYKKFVANDVVIAGLALTDMAGNEGCKLNFKFLKYGTGYFAGNFRQILNELILVGVIDGLERLFASGNDNVVKVLKHFEFPFYSKDSNAIKRLDALKKQFGIDYTFSTEDAVKRTIKGLTTATTNCADSNVACGNAMGFKSTDSVISENLASKGNIFCPNMNNLMEYKYIDF